MNLMSKPTKQQRDRDTDPTIRYAVAFLILIMTSVFLNIEQPKTISTRFASSFLTLFIVIFILNQGRVAGVYLLLTFIAPELSNPVVIGPIYMLFFFLLRDS